MRGPKAGGRGLEALKTPIVVDIADLRVTDDPGVELVTYALGSCIGLSIWDPVARVGGLLHYMLPNSSLSPLKARTVPAMFADTGIPLLFKAAYELGAVKYRLIAKVAGGAAMFETSDVMDVGRHNYLMLRKLFWRNGVMIAGEHVGDSTNRTMRLDVATGRTTVENRQWGCVEI